MATSPIPESESPDDVASAQEPNRDSPPAGPVRQGGQLVTSLGDTIFQLSQDNPRGLGTESSSRLLAVWVQTNEYHLKLEKENTAKLTASLDASREALTAEKIAHEVAKTRIHSLEGQRTLREVCLAMGVGMLGFGVEHWLLGSATTLLAVGGAILVLFGIFSGRRN